MIYSPVNFECWPNWPNGQLDMEKNSNLGLKKMIGPTCIGGDVPLKDREGKVSELINCDLDFVFDFQTGSTSTSVKKMSHRATSGRRR